MTPTTASPAGVGIETMLADPDIPLEHRLQMLAQLALDDSTAGRQILGKLLTGQAGSESGSGSESDGPAQEADKLEQLDALLTSMRDGPLRAGTFLRFVKSSGVLGDRAEILLPDGAIVLAVLPKPSEVETPDCGDTVLLDAQARAILGTLPDARQIGEEARLVRRIDTDTVEVELEHGGKHVYYAAAALCHGLDSSAVAPGHNVIVCPQRRMAFRGVPPADGLAHYQFLDRSGTPDIRIERDIAAPAEFLGQLTHHLHRELSGTALARAYRLQRCRTVFLTGGTGTGKTLNVMGFVRRMYEVSSQHTGIPIADLPPRVLRLRASEILSKWYGEAEQRIDQFFDEVEALAAERVIDADGHERELPVLVIAEEVDGLTRERGSSHDSVDDRVQTTILQRLDTTARQLADSLVIILCTSNVPSLLDPAFVRRAGGRIEHFGRLDRVVFEDVLTRKVCGIPFVTECGQDGRAAIVEVTAWLYGENADRGIIELVYAGSTQPVVKFRRDFMTGAIVERAVQQAASEACQEHEEGCDEPGLSAAFLTHALTDQVRSIVDQMTEHNAHHHVDVPRGCRVASVRPIHRAHPIPAELLRTN